MMRTTYTPRDGDQLLLDLFKGVPWDGRSPRGLTRVQIGLFFRPEPQGHEVEPDPAQLQMWPVAVRPPRVKKRTAERGAPPLLPSKSRRGSPRRPLLFYLEEE